MPYVAFVDMIGTKASARINNQEYTEAINDFTNSLKQVANFCQCKVYGYSDNAYIQTENLNEMTKFFRTLRDNLLNKHRYFTAAVDYGDLNTERISFDNKKGFSMKFTSSTTVDIYMQQCQFSGIGVSLSKNVVNDLIGQEMNDSFCYSICKKYPHISGENEIIQIYDLSYDFVVFEKIEYVLADYLLTAATNDRAGRYYITPIVSMLKCLDKEIIVNDLNKMISLLSFQMVPKAFKDINYNTEYSLYFMFSLLERVLFLREKDNLIDATKICEQIINGYNIDHSILVKSLPSIPIAVMSNTNKQRFLNILYNIK